MYYYIHIRYLLLNIHFCANYFYIRRCTLHVFLSVTYFNTYNFNISLTVFNDGSEKNILNLDGTIPVTYKGTYKYIMKLCNSVHLKLAEMLLKDG